MYESQHYSIKTHLPTAVNNSKIKIKVSQKDSANKQLDSVNDSKQKHSSEFHRGTNENNQRSEPRITTRGHDSEKLDKIQRRTHLNKTKPAN